ncbi:unnamed protein product, partial [Amoebophrya sp. A120]
QFLEKIAQLVFELTCWLGQYVCLKMHWNVQLTHLDDLVDEHHDLMDEKRKSNMTYFSSLSFDEVLNEVGETNIEIILRNEAILD